jgi:hypothetical protein
MTRHVRALALIAATSLLCGLPAGARAATTWTVNTTADDPPPGCAPATGSHCSIRQALAAARTGDTIAIPAAANHYRVTRGPLNVTVPVAISGAGESSTVIDAGGLSQVISVSTPGAATIAGLTVTGGHSSIGGAVAGGGGIELATGSLSLSGVAVSGNSVTAGQGGGGIFEHSSGTLSVAYSTVSGNSVATSSGGLGGGGILDTAGPLVLSDSAVSGNSVTLVGGAAASQGGGGIYDAGGSSTYLNDTLTGNRAAINGPAAGDGGGAILHAGSPGWLSNLTIDGNSTSAAGGGIYNASGAYTVRNTIVADNGGACAGPGAIVSTGYNLEGSNTCGFVAPGDLRNTDPQLGPLAANGGPTLTQALTPGSPAIDAGSCTDAAGSLVTSDQRGLSRPQPAGGKCDIGALEFVPASPVPDLVRGSRPAVLGSTRVRFSALVNPDGPETTVQYQYGLDLRYLPPGPSESVYDQSTRRVAIGPGYGPVTVVATVSGLVPAALYHVRVVIAGGAGTVLGPDQTFETAVDRHPPPLVLGRFVDATPAGGLVRMLIGKTFVPLTEVRRLRSGTVFDARRGSVRITSASVRGGVQSATFGGAVFRLSQIGTGRNPGLTIAALRDGAFRGVPAYAGCRKGATSSRQTLHANAIGTFQVTGRYSTGTARAAQWATTDRCNGTQTVVHRGTVTAFNLVHQVTVVLRGGHTYLARSRPGRPGSR